MTMMILELTKRYMMSINIIYIVTIHSNTGVGFYLITFSFYPYLLYMLPLQSHAMTAAAAATPISIL